MAILSDCTSCKVVDHVGTISHTLPAGWATGVAPPLDFKLFKATHEVHCLGKLWPAKSHLGPQRALDLWRLWWINLRASGVAFVKHVERSAGKRGQRFKYVWPFSPSHWFYVQLAVAAHWHFQMFRCSFVIRQTLTPPPLEQPIPSPKRTRATIELFLLPPTKLNI